MAARVLVVDHDPVHRHLVEGLIRRFGHEAECAADGAAALRRLADPVAAPIDCVLLDLVMSDLDGMGVLVAMRERGHDVPVVVQSSSAGVGAVGSAMRAGACDFIVKPAVPERLQVSLANALSTQALRHELQAMKRAADNTLGINDIFTRSLRMRGALRLAEKATASDIPVLLEGEPGVGKERIARAIHGGGARRGAPFVAVDCATVPSDLIESVLFGVAGGAPGYMADAAGGTLFIDRVDALPALAQAGLARALSVPGFNVRLIAASGRDLVQLTREGGFREELFYRLHVFPIAVPPLRARMEDMPDMLRHAVARFAAEEGHPIRAVTVEAMRRLADYRWPGNVRQFEHAVRRAVVIAEGDTIGIEDFPLLAATGRTHSEDGVVLLGALPPVPVAEVEAAAPVDALPLVGSDGHVRTMPELEAAIIRFAIEHYRGRMTQVARRLGIGRSTLYRKLAEYGLVETQAEAEPPAVAAG